MILDGRRWLTLATVALTPFAAACGDDRISAEASADTALVDATSPPVDTAPAGPVCGDGAVEAPEVCDEGAAVNGTYGHCAADCLGPAAHCGDGLLQADLEVCDDGKDNGAYGHCGYGCNGPAIRCGNGFVEEAYEACDDGDDKNGSYGFCAADCQGPAVRCGDGHVDAPWESCDDGEDNGTPGHCAADCNPVPGCGDGEVVTPEACDDGSDNGTYGHCAADCSGPGARCGDGVQHQGEACDDGALNGSYGHCDASCQGRGAYCGDGAVQPGHEACDDGVDNGAPGKCDVDCLALSAPWITDPLSASGDVEPTGYVCHDDDLLAKYMRYRLRLRGDGTGAWPGFISIGADPGQSIPAGHREPDVGCDHYWGFESCPHADLPDARGLYKWGDGTVWLADYIGALALEYAMFTDLGLDTAETLSDLGLAVHAFNRVDEHAESFYPGVPPARDGFFVRDDVPEDFAILPDGGYRFPRDDGYAGYECVAADLTCDEPDIADGSFVSQDQSLSLIWAFSLVDALLPQGTMVEGVDLPAAAREAVHRLVWFLREHGWKVKDPDGEQPPGAWGGNAIGFSNAMAKAANIVVGDEHGVGDYRNFASRTAGEASWAGLQAIWEATHFYNRTHALRLAAVNGDWDVDKMPRMAMSDGKDYFALTYALLHDATLEGPWSDWRLEALLRSAPCGGPCRGTEGCQQVPGWLGPSRSQDSGSRFGSRHTAHAEFNGLDYLSLFAAYHLYRKGRWSLAPVAAEASAEACSAFIGIEALAAAGAADGTSYDPRGACAAPDLAVEYCRRPFGAWLADAYRGKVTIIAGGGRWDCQQGQPCVIVHDGTMNTGGDDLIIGTAGPDELRGGAGNDCLVGGAGDDVLKGQRGYDELWGGPGADALYGESSGPVLSGDGDVLFGGAGDDLLDGSFGKDELDGGPGDDALDCGGGDDFAHGGEGDDTLRGRGGEDTLIGGVGDDSLIGDGGDDTLWGGPGRDKLDGEAGDDHCDGGTGPDFLRGGAGDDTIITGDIWGVALDHDRACGNGGDDTIWAGWDGDECLGGGWLLGGTDFVQGCDDGSAATGDCDSGAFNDW